jgi:hypothetical protein
VTGVQTWLFDLGTAVLTINSDKTFLLKVTRPDVGDLCEQSGDLVNTNYYGYVVPDQFLMYFTGCMTDRQPVGDGDQGIFDTMHASGAVNCYTVNPKGERDSKSNYVTFAVTK